MPMGELPGRLGQFFGMDAGDVPKDEQAFGMNPRRAYWTFALQDLASIASTHGGATGEMSSKAMEANAYQQKYQQAVMQQKQNQLYQQQIAQAALLNAWKTKDSSTTAMRNAEAMGLVPGTPEYSDFIRQASLRPLVDQSDKTQNQYYEDMLKHVPEVRDRAANAADGMSRVDAMEKLIPLLGRTGPGKDMMVGVKGFFNQVGMSWVPDFIDSMAQTAGSEAVFTGQQGAQELFRALGGDAVLAKAKELYPVSNADINFLKEINATLALNDPQAMMALLGGRRNSLQRDLDTYEWYRSALEKFEGVPPLPPIKPYQMKGTDVPQTRKTTLSPEKQKRLDELLRLDREGQ